MGPWYMSSNGIEFAQVCVNGSPLTGDQRQALRDFFVNRTYIDDDGLVCTKDWDDPSKGFNQSLLIDAGAVIGVSDSGILKIIGDIVTGVYAGHTPLLRCWDEQKTFIMQVLNATDSSTANPSVEPSIIPTLPPSAMPTSQVLNATAEPSMEPSIIPALSPSVV